jgi:predicted O-methyltransferase YrrM
MISSPSKVVRQIINFLKYYRQAGDEHSVHSPFVFSLLTNALYRKDKPEIFKRIENVRKNLLRDQRVINTVDLGAGSSFDGKVKRRTVSQTAAWFAKPPRIGAALYRIVEHLKPSVMIELGTSLGISSMYQASGNPNGTLYTIEGCAETAAFAKENFRNAGITNIRQLTGNFDAELPELLKALQQIDYAFIDGNHTYAATIKYFQLLKARCHHDSVLIFDDINWSDGMQKAWSEIKADPDVTITVDFFVFGLVFFNSGFSKQNFVLKL